MDADGPTLYPVLRYADAKAAIGWLERAFGFERVVAYEDDQGVVRHAELAFGLPDDTGERDPQSHPDAVQILERWFVRGSIDMVEQNLETALRRLGTDPAKLQTSSGVH